MQRMDVAGASYREIAAMLDARGVRPHHGKAWYASTVRGLGINGCAGRPARSIKVQVHDDEGIASHIDPEPCADIREDTRRSVGKGTYRLSIEPRNPLNQSADAVR